jgi:hypothetical protein
MTAFTVTHFENIMDPAGGQPIDYSDLEEFYGALSKCKLAPTELDKKRSAGWVRGPLKDNYRKKENITETRLLIIDVDKSPAKPYCINSPLETHEVLKDFGINHIIYTTWSNRGNGKYRYRVVIPASRVLSDDEVELNSRKIVDILNGGGLSIEYAAENKAMSQMWFYSSSPNPKEWFESYLYVDGTEYRPTTVGKYSSSIVATPEDGYTKNIDILEIKPDVCAVSNASLISNIRNHHEIHFSMLNLSYQMIKDGNSEYWINTFLDSLLGPNTGDKRIEDRRLEIPRLISGARERLVKESVVKKVDWSVDRGSYVEPPVPPGMLGQMVRMAHDQQSYQNMTVAVVAAIGAVSGIAGYKFQCPAIPSFGCNNYYLVSMKTGGGKDFISKFIINLYRRAAQDASYQQFVGAKKFTGGKSIRKLLESKPCCVSVMTEFGQILHGTSGDPVSTRQTLLEQYSRSGPNDVLGAEGYSKEEDSLKELNHPSMTLIGESEPSSFIAALNGTNSINDGFVPRCLVLRADQDTRPYLNRETSTKFDSDIIEHIAHMMKECKDDTIPYFMKWENIQLERDVYDHADMWTDIYNKFDGNDQLKCVLSTRMHIHTIKVATVCAIMNRRALIVKREDWEWAVKFTQYCFDNANSFMEGGNDPLMGGDGSIDDAIKVAASKISKLFCGDLSGGQYYLDAHCKQQMNTIPANVMFKLLGKVPAIKKVGSKARPGYNLVLDYCIKEGLMLKEKYKGKEYYIINGKMKEYME